MYFFIAQFLARGTDLEDHLFFLSLFCTISLHHFLWQSTFRTSDCWLYGNHMGQKRVFCFDNCKLLNVTSCWDAVEMVSLHRIQRSLWAWNAEWTSCLQNSPALSLQNLIFFMHLIGNSSAIISWPSRLVTTHGRIILRFREQCFLCVSLSRIFNLKHRQSQSALCSLFPSDSNRKHNHGATHVVGQTMQFQVTVAPHVTKEPKLDRANSTEIIVPEEESWEECYFNYS